MANEDVPAENAGSTATDGGNEDLYRAYQFKLEIPGVARGHFTRCTGMSVDITPIRYREGGLHQVVKQLPGQVDYGDVTLSYGVIKADSEAIWQWLFGAIQGTVTPQQVSIYVLDAAGVSEKMRFNLNGAWPRSWRGADLDAMSRDIAIEQITLVYETLTRL